MLWPLCAYTDRQTDKNTQTPEQQKTLKTQQEYHLEEHSHRHPFFFFPCSTRSENQGLKHARQVLYHFSNSP